MINTINIETFPFLWTSIAADFLLDFASELFGSVVPYTSEQGNPASNRRAEADQRVAARDRNSSAARNQSASDDPSGQPLACQSS